MTIDYILIIKVINFVFHVFKIGQTCQIYVHYVKKNLAILFIEIYTAKKI